MQGSSAGFSAVMAGQDITVDHQCQVFLPYRRNLITTPNYNHTARGNWNSYANVLSFTEAAPPALTNGEALAGKITWATGAINSNLLILTVATVPGKVYTLSVSIYQPASTPRLNIGAVGNLGATAPSVVGAWQRFYMTFTATEVSSTIFAGNGDAATAGQITWITDWLLEQTDQQLPYFDGDMAGARWANDPINSISELNLIGFTDASLAIESMSVNRDTTTDMPNGTRLVTGYPAADATVEMAGAFTTDPTNTPAGLFNPYNTASPLYGTDPSGAWIQTATGVYPGGQASAELITSFTGLLDDVEIDLNTGSVTISAIDYRNVLKTTPALPSFWAVPVHNTAYNASPLLTAHYGIDYLIRAAGIYSSPPPRAACMYYQSLHGSLWPEINFGNVTATCATVVGSTFITNDNVRQQFGQGKWSPQTMVGPFLTCASMDDPGLIVGDTQHGIYGEVTTYLDPSISNQYLEIDLGHALAVGGPVTSEYRLRVQSLGTGQIQVSMIYQPYNGTAGTPQGVAQNFTVAAGMHTISYSGTWLGFNSIFMVISVDAGFAGSAAATLTFPASHTTGQYIFIDKVLVACAQTGWAVENIQITNELGAGNGFSSNFFTPTAYLDASLNDQMTTLPDTAGGDPWQVLQQAMDAEQGVAGFDEKAIFWFYNRDTLKSRLSTKLLDASINLKSTQIGIQQSGVYTHVQVPVSQFTLTPGGAVWQANSPIFVPALGNVIFNVNLATPAVNVAETDSGFAPSGTQSTGQTYWRAGDRITGGTAILGGIAVRVLQLSQKVLQVNINNSNAVGAWLVTPPGYPTPAGTPCLVIGGQSLSAVSNVTDNNGATSAGLMADVQWPPLDEGGAVNNPRGDILLPVAANSWQQDLDVATEFAWDLLADLYQNRPMISNAHAILDPRVQLSDRNTLIVAEYGIDDDFYLNGIHSTVDRSTFDQELVLRAVAAPGEWVLGDAVKSILAATTVM